MVTGDVVGAVVTVTAVGCVAALVVVLVVGSDGVTVAMVGAVFCSWWWLMLYWCWCW